MSTILPVRCLAANHAEIGFVHQSRRLEAVSGALAFHVMPSQTVELVDTPAIRGMINRVSYLVKVEE